MTKHTSHRAWVKADGRRIVPLGPVRFDCECMQEKPEFSLDEPRPVVLCPRCAVRFSSVRRTGCFAMCTGCGIVVRPQHQRMVVVALRKVLN